MQSRDWDELRRLMSIARQQNLLGEALQAVEQAPLAPIPRAKPKPKAKCAAAMSGGAGTGGMMDAVTGGMTDASKRRVPDDDEDWEAVEGQVPLTSAADVAFWRPTMRCRCLGFHGWWAFYPGGQPVVSRD